MLLSIYGLDAFSASPFSMEVEALKKKNKPKIPAFERLRLRKVESFSTGLVHFHLGYMLQLQPLGLWLGCGGNITCGFQFSFSESPLLSLSCF